MIDLSKVNYNKVGFCRFKKFRASQQIGKNKYLLTNDVGDYIFLKDKEFNDFLEGKLKTTSHTYKSLKEKNFVRDYLDFEGMIKKYRERNAFLWQGPGLHIIVVTLRCNHRCIYCQTSSRGIDEEGFDMDISTAQKVVDTIFASPNKHITIEFQGGEPLLNWKTVKFITDYALKKSKKEKKDLLIALVSNFSLLNDNKLREIIDKRVSLCTSLDGPEKIHNRNRIMIHDNSYKNVVKWIKKIHKIQQEHEKEEEVYRLNALVTISKHSLSYPKGIIDEYIKQGFSEIHLRPLSNLGFSKTAKKKIGYTPEEFIKFYKKALDHIIQLNLKGKSFYERTARIFLAKILTDKDPNFLDLRSPCGAGIGQLVYNYDGKVYTCDEGRMVEGDEFMIGDVKKDNYEKIVGNKTVKAMCVASCLDGLSCDNCVYKPYCGVCPVGNYAQYGSIFAQIPNSQRCKINKAILDYLFEKLQDKKVEEIFKNWLKIRRKIY